MLLGAINGLSFAQLIIVTNREIARKNEHAAGHIQSTEI